MEEFIYFLLCLAAVAVYGWLCYLAVVELWWPSVPFLVVGGAGIGVLIAVGVLVATLLGVGALASRTVGPDDVADPRRFPATRTAFRRDSAWPQYLVAQARMDLVTYSSRLRDVVLGFWRAVYGGVVKAPAVLIFWPVLLFPLVALAAGTVAAAAAGAAALGVCTAVLVAAWVIWIVLAGAVRGGDRGIRRLRDARGSCPHSGCNHVTDLPSYRCSCGEVHRDVRPGRLGAVFRRCACDRLLPTTVLRAGAQLTALCPRCDQPLRPGAATVTDVRIPVFGPVSAGKTRFVHAALVGLGRYLPSVGGTLDAADERSGRLLREGADLVATAAPTFKTLPDRPPAAVSVRIALGGRGALVHVFDAAGEYFAQRGQSRQLPFLDDAQGFVLVVDPFSIGQVAEELGGAFADRLAAANPAHDDPENAYQVTVQALRDAGLRLRRRSLAVVVVKADLLADLPPGAALGANPTSAGVRRWLCDHGLDNVVLGAERDFGAVRYFLVSSWTEWSATDPSAGADAPLRWLIGRVKLRLPDLTVVNADVPTQSEDE